MTWRILGSGMKRTEGMRFQLWWSRSDDGIGCVGVMVNEVLCKLVVEGKMVHDSRMVTASDFDSIQ